MLSWLATHGNEIQALSGLAIAIFTLVLLLVTGVYVRANWKIMNLMEADLRYRTKPIPDVKVETSALGSHDWFHYTITIRTTNAPLRFDSLECGFLQSGTPPKHRHIETFPYIGARVLRTKEEYSHSAKFFPADPIESWNVTLTYSDLTGRVHYRNTFDSFDQHLSNEEILPTESFWKRLLIRIKRKIPLRWYVWMVRLKHKKQ